MPYPIVKISQSVASGFEKIINCLFDYYFLVVCAVRVVGLLGEFINNLFLSTLLTRTAKTG